MFLILAASLTFAAAPAEILDMVSTLRGWQVEGPSTEGLTGSRAIPLTKGDGLSVPELRDLSLTVGRARFRKADRIRVTEASLPDSALAEGLFLHWQREVLEDAEASFSQRVDSDPSFWRIRYTEDGERRMVLVRLLDTSVTRVDLYSCPTRVEDAVLDILVSPK